MEFKKFNNDYVVRLNKGENVIESLKKLCREEDIKLAEITGLGASNKVEIGVFNTNTKEYKTKVFDGMFEITSLVGNVTRKDGEVYLHIHINLVESKISATSEIIVRKIDGEVGRKISEEIGLNLLSF